MRPERLYRRLLAGAMENVDFGDSERLLLALGFELQRVRGSHRIYVHSTLQEQLSVQPRSGEAKPYQVRQLLNLVRQYNLRVGGMR